MDVTPEEQYQRDIARIEAHRLALKDDGFSRLTQLIREEAREHARYLRDERGAPIELRDRDPLRITIENADGLRFATVTFDTVRHEAEVRGEGIHYQFAVTIDGQGKSVVTGRNYGQTLGIVTENTIIDAVRHAIESITDLPRPIVRK